MRHECIYECVNVDDVGWNVVGILSRIIRKWLLVFDNDCTRSRVTRGLTDLLIMGLAVFSFASLVSRWWIAGKADLPALFCRWKIASLGFLCLNDCQILKFPVVLLPVTAVYQCTLYCQTKTNFFVGKLADVGCLGWPEFSSPIFTALLGLI